MKQFWYGMFFTLVILAASVMAGVAVAKAFPFDWRPKLTLFTPDNCQNVGSYVSHGETKYRYECRD